ncbi:MAG: hypothetical protein JXX29_20150 [Deltaproteobacteria bacterium]|nr:hypothetical protein [Deltaproteobacteria bacterium]MBN2674005.1 hypothetical protein [Deltaproteobacteria bacterium]
MKGIKKQFGRLGSAAVWITGVLILGCVDDLDGVPCVENDDCESGVCVDGTCAGTGDADGDTDGDTDSDSDADADVMVDVAYTLPLSGVDILLVVDDTGSMVQEQEILTTSLFNLINNITEDMLGAVGPVADGLDIRLAVTTTDMGVSFDGQPYNEIFSPHPVCSLNAGFGNDGMMLTEYNADSFSTTLGNKISCSKTDNACPPDWNCADINATGVGVCRPANGSDAIVCPDVSAFVENEMYLTPGAEAAAALGYGYREFVSAGACLSNVGTDGCAFEQQLSAVPAALTKHGQGVFLREDALTVVIVISDENDCSLATDEWHVVPELNTNERNVACGLHEDMMMDIVDLRNQILDAKTVATGVPSAGSIIFAAITGVPMVDECQGFGSSLTHCGDVALAHGTMASPSIIERMDPNGNPAIYYEYACERFDNEGIPITQAYPATRIVELARIFGNYGYVYSICNSDWTPAMDDISARITESLSR